MESPQPAQTPQPNPKYFWCGARDQNGICMIYGSQYTSVPRDWALYKPKEEDRGEVRRYGNKNS